MKRLSAFLALSLVLLPALAFGQAVESYPNATSPLTGTERILGAQASSYPCTNCTVNITPLQIADFTAAEAANYGLVYNNNGSIAGLVPTATGQYCLEWTALNAAPTLVTCTSGSGTVSDGSGTTTANEVAVSTSTAHNIGYATTLPTSALPALAGDVTSSAGSNSVTVSKVNGASLPASAGLLGTNASSQIIAAPASGVTAGSYTSANITVNAQGQVTAAANGTASASSITPGTTTVSGATAPCFIDNSTGTTMGCASPAQAIGVLNSTAANAQTGTTYTFVLGDENGEVTMNNASANTATIPPNSSVAYPVGTLLTVQELGAGVTTLSPGSGVTITSAAYGSSTSQTYSLGGVYGFIQVQQTATNTWNVVGWDTPANQSLAALGSEMQAYLKASTQFTYAATGCTPSASSGGPFAGKITLAAGPCTSIVITMNGATGFTDTNGYDCSVDDETLQAAGTWFGKWGASADNTTTATIPIPGAAGSTDVISFVCHPRSL